jgi:hypothetical protein
MGRERAKPISFSSKVLNICTCCLIHRRRPIGLLTDVISVCHTFVALKRGREGKRGREREGQAHLIQQQGFKHTCCWVHGRKTDRTAHWCNFRLLHFCGFKLMVEIWAERAKPISFSSKVLNITCCWSMDERPIGPLTGV